MANTISAEHATDFFDGLRASQRDGQARTKKLLDDQRELETMGPEYKAVAEKLSDWGVSSDLKLVKALVDAVKQKMPSHTEELGHDVHPQPVTDLV